MTHQEDDHDVDEPLLERLRAADPLREPRWQALLEGRTSPAEARAAREASARGDAPAGAHEAFEPMSAERRDRILAAVLGGAESDAEPREGAPKVEAPRVRGPARRRSAIAIAGGLALAATIMLAVGLRSPGPLPDYEMSIGGGATVRGGPAAPSSTGPAEVLHLAPGGRARITLAPATAAHGVEARFFVGSGGEVRRWDVAARITDEGTVELDDVRADRIAAAAGGAPGTSPREVDLWIAVARAGRMPADEELTSRIAGRAVGQAARLLHVRVVLDETPR